MPGPTIDELTSPEYELLGEMTHATLADFVIDYFFRRRSWLVWLHHVLSLATLAAAVAVALHQGRPFLRCLGDFVLGFATMLIILLPLHEAIHAVAYRAVGAREIRWDYSSRMLAVWVIAHRFVAGRSQFTFVALAPFVLINGGLLALILQFPGSTVYLLFALLWHLHGCAGDWSLLNFVWLHRRRGFWTFDDASEGKSYFFGRARGDAQV